MNKAKKAFQQLSQELENALPFSLHYNWWEEVITSDWEVAVLQDGNEIKAVWPYLERKKGPWKMLCQPAFTPYGGPIFNYPADQKRERKYSWEYKVIEELIEELGDYSELLINCRMSLHNTLPFIWAGFEDKKKYTYLLSLEQEEESIWNGFRENIRRQIRKAEKEVKISVSDDPAQMGKLLKESFEGHEDPYPIEDEGIYQRIYNYLKKYDCGQFLQAIDESGEIHAMMVWIHDDHSAYYLIGGSASKHKNSGAMSLLMHEAIKQSKKLNLKHFNFEGSMVPSVEKYLRGFGGELSPYSCLIHNRSSSLKVLRKLKG